MSNILLDFRPLLGFGNPHLQTLFSAFLRYGSKEPPSAQKLIVLPDGDKISLEITTPKHWTAKDPTVVLIHGLCGSHRSAYLVRMAKRLEEIGIRAVRMNLRGCGSGKGLVKSLYHSGRSEDALAVLKALKEEHPDSPITLIGYSLGGNLALKLAGELQHAGQAYLKKVIAICPSVDLYMSVQMLQKRENALYQWKFMKQLCARALEFDPTAILPKRIKIFEFDDVFTAPRNGFANAHDYYSKCSAAPLVPHIALPCHILFAEDDPLVSHSSLDLLHLPPNVKVFKTKKGGHLGFLGNPLHERGFWWLDSLLIEWIR